MKPAPLLLLGLLAACAAAERPFAPVSDVAYSALGEQPFWMVTIGDDSIVLTLGKEEGTAGPALRNHRFERVLPRVADGVTRWESGEGVAVIAVEARPGPCTAASGARYADRVTVSLSGRQLSGCGGRIISGRPS